MILTTLKKLISELEGHRSNYVKKHGHEPLVYDVKYDFNCEKELKISLCSKVEDRPMAMVAVREEVEINI